MSASARDHTVGIDEGTTGVRAVVVSADGGVAAISYREIAQRYPRPGWVEQDPQAIWSATQAVTRRALDEAGLGPGDVAAVGITNQRGSAVLFCSDGAEALGPVVSWQDQRTAQRCEQLAGQGIFASPLTASTKYEWLVRNHGDGRARDRLRCGTIDSWLLHCLSRGAAHATDHSNASVSGLYEWVKGEYDPRPIEALGLDLGWLPAIRDSSCVVGETDRLTFGASVPIASLAGDQHAAMYGLACLGSGDVKLSLGTSGMMTLNAGATLAASGPGTYPLVLWSLDGVRSFCLEGTTVTAGAAAQWLRDGLGIVASLDEIEPLARSVESSEGIWAVPAFQGLGTPYLDPAARATIGGLSRAASRAHVVRAVLEGITWRCREVFDALVATVDRRPAVLRVDGGAAANGLLLEMLADCLGIAIETPTVLDSAAVGAALLAGRAVGLWRDQDVAARWRPARRVEPRLPAAERDARYARWRRLVELVRSAGT
jgi:glycerol kinase